MRRFITVVVSFLSMMMAMTMTTTTLGVVATSYRDIRSRNSIVGTSTSIRIGGDEHQQQQRERDLVVSFDAFLPSFSYDEEAMVEVTMPTLTLLLNGVVPTGAGDGSGSTTKAQPASTLFGEEGSGGLGDVAYDTIQTTMNDYLDTVLAKYYENDTPTNQYDFVKARTEVVEDRPFLWGPTTTGSVITIDTILTFRDDENKKENEKEEEEDSGIGIGIGTTAANQLQQQSESASASGSASRGEDERLGESDRNQSNGSDRHTNNPNIPSELELDYAAGYVWNDLSEFQKRLLVTTTIEQIEAFDSLTSITSQQDFPITTTPVTEAEKEIVVNTNTNNEGGDGDGDPQEPEQPVNNQEEVEEGTAAASTGEDSSGQEEEEKLNRGDIVLEDDAVDGATTNIIAAISESELKSNETERLNPLWPALIVGIAVFLCTIIMLGYRRQSSSRRLRGSKGGGTHPVRVHDNLTLEEGGGSGEEFEIEEDRFYNCVLDNNDHVQHDPEHQQRQEWRCLSSSTRRNNSLHNDNDVHENDRPQTNNNIDIVHDDVVSIGRSASGGGGSALRSGGGSSFRGRARCYNAARTRDTDTNANTNTNANDAYSVSYKNVDDDGSVSEMGSGVGGGREGGDEGRSCFNGTRGMLFGKNKDKHDQQQQRQVNVTIITGEDDVDEDYNSEEDNGDDYIDMDSSNHHHHHTNQRKIDLTTRMANTSSHLYYGEGQPTQESWRNISPNGMSGKNGNGTGNPDEEEEQDYCDLTPIEKKTFVTYMKSGMTLEEASSQVLLERSLGTNITTNLGHTPSGGGEAVVVAGAETTATATAAHRTSPTRKKKKRKKKQKKESSQQEQQQQPTHQRPQVKPPSAAVQKAQQLLSEIMVEGQTTMVQHDIPPPSQSPPPCHQSNTNMLLNNPCSSNNLQLLQGVVDEEETDANNERVMQPIA